MFIVLSQQAVASSQDSESQSALLGTQTSQQSADDDLPDLLSELTKDGETVSQSQVGLPLLPLLLYHFHSLVIISVIDKTCNAMICCNLLLFQ